MNNFEWLLSFKSPEDLGHELCNMNDFINGDCDKCMANSYCHVGTNGFIEWLKQDRTDFVKFMEERGLE